MGHGFFDFQFHDVSVGGEIIAELHSNVTESLQ